ncbi:MAG: hypothetical protein B7Y39_14970 [Bdellovibrio sp. 28-41-41]|nr:MAG: hypothetical protein B7Y39_14970 [Bdellovibrio sp. 28-41-41]
MSHSNLRYLFLHFGPGGNAALERKWLTSYKSAVDFWDQPKDVSSFEELVQQCVNQYNVGQYNGIIAHSFGCDLALKVKDLVNIRDSNLILISPLRDLPKAFINFAQHLASEAAIPERKQDLTAAAKGMEMASNKIEAFARLVTAVSSDPLYYRRLWAQASKLKEFEAVASQFPPVDMNCWRTVLVDYILNHQVSLKGRKAKVYIGSEDPYYGLIRDEESYWSEQGGNVYLIEDVGHYPHLEAKVFEKIFGTS